MSTFKHICILELMILNVVTSWYWCPPVNDLNLRKFNDYIESCRQYGVCIADATNNEAMIHRHSELKSVYVQISQMCFALQLN